MHELKRIDEDKDPLYTFGHESINANRKTRNDSFADFSSSQASSLELLERCNGCQKCMPYGPEGQNVYDGNLVPSSPCVSSSDDYRWIPHRMSRSRQLGREE